jgi:hypothetical protein
VQVQQLEQQMRLVEVYSKRAVAARTAAHIATYSERKCIDDCIFATRAAQARTEDRAGIEMAKSHELEKLLQS